MVALIVIASCMAYLVAAGCAHNWFYRNTQADEIGSGLAGLLWPISLPWALGYSRAHRLSEVRKRKLPKAVATHIDL